MRALAIKKWDCADGKYICLSPAFSVGTLKIKLGNSVINHGYFSGHASNKGKHDPSRPLTFKVFFSEMHPVCSVLFAVLLV